MNPYDPGDPGERPGQYGGPNQGQFGSPNYTPPTFQQTPRPAAAKAPLVDFSKFSPGQWLVLGGSVILLIGSLLPWYTYSYPSGKGTISKSFSGWDSSLGKATVIIAVLALALFAVRLFNVKLPFAMPTSDRTIYIGLGAEALLLAVLYLFNSTGIPIFGIGATAGPSIGLFLVLLASIATAVGGYLHSTSRPRY